MAASEWTVTASLKHVVGQNGNYGSSGNRYLHLWSVLPAADGSGGTAVGAAWYAPQEISGSMATVTTGTYTVQNSAVITYTTAASSTQTIVGFSVHATTSTSSNMYRYEALTNSVNVSTAATVQFTTGSLVFGST